MKAMPATSSQYTLHDESHFLRVVELMAMVLGESIDQLSSIELCLLILTAYFHDQGMVMNEDEYEQLSTDAEFQLFRDNWYIDHPNQKEIQTQLQNSNLNDEESPQLGLGAVFIIGPIGMIIGGAIGILYVVIRFFRTQR